MATTPITIGSGGAFTWWHEPRAVRFVGTHDKTYYGYVTAAGKCIVAERNNADGAVASFELRASGFDDDHANPTVWVRPSDKRIVVFYAAHNGSAILYRISTNPEDASAFGPELSILIAQVTYPTPIFLSAENGGNGRLYLFCRGTNRSLSYFYSDDIYGSGVTSPTWSDEHELVANTGGSQGVYAKFGTNHADRIDLAITNALISGNDVNDVRHCIFAAEELFRSDGTTSLGSRSGGDFPLAFTDVLDVVYDSSATGRKAWVNDCSYSGGNPEIVFTEFVHDTEHRYHYARWGGSSWGSHQLPDARSARITALTASSSTYMAGLCLDRAAEGVVYAALGDNDESQLWRYQTEDGGESWTRQRVSSADDRVQHIRPVVPWNLSTPADGPHESCPVLWMRGSYDDFTGAYYSTDIVTAAIGSLDQPAFPDDWSRKCAITLDTAAGESDLEDFTVLLTEANLPDEIWETAQEDGGDIRFTSDSAGETLLPFYLVRFDPNDESAEIRVLVPTLSASTNTTIYIWYGSEGRALPSVFDLDGKGYALPDYDAFWALDEPSGYLRNFIPGMDWNVGTTSPTYQAPAKFGRGVTTSSDTIPLAGTLPKAIGSARPIVFGGWFTLTQSTSGFIMASSALEILVGAAGAGSVRARVYSNQLAGTLVTGLDDSAQHHCVFVIESGSLRTIVNGAEAASVAGTVTAPGHGSMQLASRVSTNHANETIEELFIRRRGSDADWIATEYANQNDPAGFATAGTPGDVNPDPNALSGTSAATSGTTGTLSGAGALSGISAATSNATGSLNGATSLSGTSAATSGATGSLTNATPAGLEGTAAATSGATATLSAIGRLIGSSQIVTNATGTLANAIGYLSGTVTAMSGCTGNLRDPNRIWQRVPPASGTWTRV